METEDPREALKAKDVTTRAAAARDLGRIGAWADVPELVRMATGDKSSAVRLYTAAAAGDIVWRYRGAAGQTPLDAAQRAQVHAWVKAVDPGTTPGLLMMLSAVADEAAIDRLGRMLRDPRNEVRAGATTALRRMALSGAPGPDEALELAVVGWLAPGRVPQDVILELIKLIGEVGWVSLAEGVRWGSTAGRLHGAAAEEALERLRKRSDPATWHGVWIDEGLDVLEIAATRDRRAGVAVEGAWAADGKSAMVVADGRATIGGAPARLVWAPRLGEAEGRFLALQHGGATWWKQEGKDLPAAVEEGLDAFGKDKGVLQALAGWLAPMEGATALRARALLAWKLGDAAQAAAWLEELAAGKKPKVDVYYWLGAVLADLGRKPEAVAALDQFLEKIPKKGEYRKQAETLRKKLG